MSSLLWPALVYCVVLALHLALPARAVDGYVIDRDTGKPLRYRLNGLRVFFVVVVLWAIACKTGLLPWGAFYQYRWQMAAGACALGLLFSFIVVIRAPPVAGANVLADFYLGRLENPQWGGARVDAKMYLYLDSTFNSSMIAPTR